MPSATGRSLTLVVLLAGCSGSPPPKSSAGSQQPILAGDGASPPASPDQAPPPAAARPREPGPPAGGVDELRRLEGRSEAEVLAELGSPSARRTFAMADCCHEFEIELYNTYPPGKGHDAVEIHEWTWRYDGYALTVWLHDPGSGWQVLETSRYADDVEF